MVDGLDFYYSSLWVTTSIEFGSLVVTRTQAKLALGSVWEIFPETRIKFGLGFWTVHSKFE